MPLAAAEKLRAASEVVKYSSLREQIRSAGFVWAGELNVDVVDDAGFLGAGVAVGGNELRANRLHRLRFGRREEAPGRPCLASGARKRGDARGGGKPRAEKRTPF